MYKTRHIIVLIILSLFHTGGLNSATDKVIHIHKVSPHVINPLNGQQAGIHFSGSVDGQAIIRIYDRKFYQVREISLESVEAEKMNTAFWDGKDDQGLAVPNEAYFFTIEVLAYSGTLVEYDPTVLLKLELKPFQVQYDSNSLKLNFTLDQDAVVDIRSGIADGGPMVNKLIEWEPMLRGKYSIPWDGWDAHHVMHVAKHAKHHLFAQIVPLPDHSIFITGNPQTQGKLYSTLHDRNTRILKRKENTAYSDQLFSQLDVYPYKEISPLFSFEFNGAQSNKQDLPVLRDEVILTIRLEESVKQSVTEARYEILVFIDDHFVTEVEEGRSPARLALDTSLIGIGEHVITINVVTLQGGVATSSKRFIKEN